MGRIVVSPAWGRLVVVAATAALMSCGGGTTARTAGPSPTPATTLQRPASGGSSAASDVGLLEQFAPRSTTNWWAIVEANLTSRSYVVRTVDSGTHWQDVSPLAGPVASGFFLDTSEAWVETETGAGGEVAALYRTENGGVAWQRLGAAPSAACALQFIDSLRGWCSVIGAAAGSETVTLYRTDDGGTDWTEVSRTDPPAETTTPGTVPFGCDKSVTFTSALIGWASSFCNGGSPYLYRSNDGGSHWEPGGAVPLPSGAPTPQGEGLSAPVVDKADMALAVDIGGNPGATAIATSTNSGSSWSAQLVPGAPRRWNADLVDPTHWRFTDGAILLTTNDGSGTWHTQTPNRPLIDQRGSPLTLNFLSESVGWAVPQSDTAPLLWTTDAGARWTPITIIAGQYQVPANAA